MKTDSDGYLRHEVGGGASLHGAHVLAAAALDYRPQLRLSVCVTVSIVTIVIVIVATMVKIITIMDIMIVINTISQNTMITS